LTIKSETFKYSTHATKSINIIVQLITIGKQNMWVVIINHSQLAFTKNMNTYVMLNFQRKEIESIILQTRGNFSTALSLSFSLKYVKLVYSL